MNGINLSGLYILCHNIIYQHSTISEKEESCRDNTNSTISSFCFLSSFSKIKHIMSSVGGTGGSAAPIAGIPAWIIVAVVITVIVIVIIVITTGSTSSSGPTVVNPCQSNADCPGTSICSVDGNCYAVDGIGGGGGSTTCMSDSDCSAPTPACLDGTCVQCTTNEHCVDGICNTDTNMCEPYACACPADAQTILPGGWPEENGGNSIVFYNGLLHYFTGDIDDEYYHYTYDPVTENIATIVSGGSLVGPSGVITAIVWYEPNNIFIAVTNDGDVFSLDSSFGNPTVLNTDQYCRGLAVMPDGTIYATDIEDGNDLFELNTTTWSFSSLGNMTEDGEPIYIAFGMNYNSADGMIYLSYGNDGDRTGVGILDPVTRVITPTCLYDPEEDQGIYADIAFDLSGGMWLQMGSNGGGLLAYLPTAPCTAIELPHFDP